MKTGILFPGVSAVLLTALLWSGCAKVGPDYAAPEPPDLPKSWKNNTGGDVLLWWRNFNDPVLERLIQKAGAQNLDLRSAGLRVVQARAALGIAEGLTFPQGQALSGLMAGVRKSGRNFTTAGLGFDLAWETDLWGKYARNIESAEASLYASVASYEDILVSVTAEVARQYITYRTAQERLAFAKRHAAIQERVTQMTRVQFNAGNVSELDWQQARTQLYMTRASIPGYALEKVRARNAIAMLLGTLPEMIEELLALPEDLPQRLEEEAGDGREDGFPRLGSIIENSVIPSVQLPAPLRIDANIVRRRPDLRVAELQARAQSARIGSAEAELYPHFSLFGSIGYDTNLQGTGWTFGTDALTLSAGPAFQWNILQYGRIKNSIRLEDARFQESLSNYNGKVIGAVQEVSDAMEGCALSARQLAQTAKAVEATLRALNLSIAQYNNGLVTYQRLLSSVENLTYNEDAYAQLRGSAAIWAVSLYKALGGGWEAFAGASFLRKEDVRAMESRTDWGGYLDAAGTTLPEGIR